MYVGAFWRADQYGERLIRVNRPPSNDAIDGDWAAYVLEGEDWIVLDTAPSTDAGVGTESPAADGNDPDFDERHRVRGFRTSVSGSVAATPTTSRPDNRIWFRIGLNGPYTPTIDAPARYGMILLVYGGTENPKYRIIRIRQGEGDDYLILPSNVEEEARGIIRKVSPYNLSAPGFSALTGEPWVNLDFHGGDWTDYPTQAGAFFQWQNPRQGYGRRAWHPGQSGGPSYDTPVNAAPWNPDLYEACPVGYRRPDASMGTRAGAQAYHNELTRSLNIRSESEQDMVRGLYADGFFDRRYQGSTQTRVATSTWQTASGGTLFYDSGPRGASIFLPDAGRLGHNTTDYEGSLSTSSGNYWVGGTPSYQLPNYLYLSSNARMYYLDNFYSFSIRCVVDPHGPRSIFLVPERVEFVYSGETLPVEITSHRADGFALGWEVAGYDADNDGIFSKNEKPAWLTMPASDAGSTPVHSVDITVRAAPTVSTGANDLALRAMETTTGTPAAPLDLSKVYDPAGQNTANCYVVNGPGHYKLPLVYGNAIRGGKPNTAAYTGASFVDHDNNPIASPYIAGAADATLVWMDSPGLVTNVRLVDDRHFLAFDLSPVSIVQGNAVVAVRNSAGVILWSWHIWVTPVAVFAAADPLAATFEMTGTNARYRVMNYNIGWVTSSGGRMFREHRATVRLRQVVSGRERDMLIVLKSGPTDATTGRNPYFQWGRKDPMPPAQGTSDTEVTIFGPPDLRLGYEGSIGSVNEAILHPNLFCTAPGIWPAGGATDLWDASDPALYDDNDAAFARTTSVKTVYDPSPAGFRVPLSDPFSALTTANFDWTPVYGYASRRYGASNLRFLPAAGRRIAAGQLSDVNTHGYYWTSQGWIDGVSAKRLEFGDDDPSGGGEILDVTNGDFKAFGYSIRPVADADPVPLP